MRADLSIPKSRKAVTLCADLTREDEMQALLPAVEQNKGIDELVTGMHKLPQVMVNVEVPEPDVTAQCAELKKAVSAKEKELSDRGRILVRASGTEPLLRVMVEGEDASEVREIANELAYVAENHA